LQQGAAHAAIVANELARNSSNDVTLCGLSPDGAVLAKAVPGDGLASARWNAKFTIQKGQYVLLRIINLYVS
jgi:hypothetical protein